MPVKIGDYVISDGKITSVEKETNYNGYHFQGNGFGQAFGRKDNDYTYNSRDQSCWYSKKSNKIATVADLKIFTDAIAANAPDLKRLEVKEFIKKATKWILLNDPNLT